MDEKRDTPLTDAAAFWTPATEDAESVQVVPAEHARKLERANAGLVDFAKLVLSGLQRGNIKAKPIIDVCRAPGAASMAMYSLEQIAERLIEKSASALESAKATRGEG